MSIRLEGPLTVDTVPELWARLAGDPNAPSSSHSAPFIDASAVTEIDSAGLAFLTALARVRRARLMCVPEKARALARTYGVQALLP
ncbi:MAG: STAS domain-containing protein [Casimicrobiaceae bacterium]|nr:STAS domain-containing protein [Casimicrobiaceae bacterium]MCX8098433.1 STAS domain-containing protein [Casimicrobiaceae bacterium]MDW8311145.1 STAS domain-containing protein [Burkholderiales bacterium]